LVTGFDNVIKLHYQVVDRDKKGRVFVPGNQIQPIIVCE